MRENKNWGQVQHIFASPHAGVSCLVVKKGQNCSLHYHVDRVNLFSVLEGCIAVEEWGWALAARDGQQYAPLRERQGLHILHPGETVFVQTRIWHRFRVIDSGHVVEVYYPDEGETVRADDIVRFNQGGPDDLEDLRHLL